MGKRMGIEKEKEKGKGKGKVQGWNNTGLDLCSAGFVEQASFQVTEQSLCSDKSTGPTEEGSPTFFLH